MDLSHAEYLHKGSFSSGVFDKVTIEVKEDGDRLKMRRILHDVPIPPFFRAIYDPGSSNVDHRQDLVRHPSQMIEFEFGVVMTGEPWVEGRHPKGQPHRHPGDGPKHALLRFVDAQHRPRQCRPRGGAATKSGHDVARWLDEVGAKFEASTLVGRLAQDEKVLCALARAFAAEARIIVLDEVSASLPAPEMDRLAVALKAARREGTAYLFVTHRLAEVFQLADHVTILRDGEVAMSAPTVSVTHDEVVGAILGKARGDEGARRSGGRAGTPRLRVSGLLGAGLAAAVDIQVAGGEVLAVCGLVGSGTRAVARLLGGAAAPTGGVAELDGSPLSLGVPHRLAASGCAYIPGDRLREGALSELSIRENFFPTRRPGRSDADGVIRFPGAERRAPRDLAARFEVRPCGDVERPLSALSGGNQQKIIFGRAADAAKAACPRRSDGGGGYRLARGLVRLAARSHELQVEVASQGWFFVSVVAEIVALACCFCVALPPPLPPAKLFARTCPKLHTRQRLPAPRIA